MRRGSAIPKVLAATALAVCGLALGVGLKADDAADDMKKFAGKWKVAEMTSRGQPVPAETRSAISFEFAAGKMKLSNAKRQQSPEINFALALDAGKTPRRFDAVAADGNKKGTTMKGLYEFAGAKLKLALPNKPNGERPTTFAAAAKGAEAAVFTLERAAGN